MKKTERKTDEELAALPYAEKLLKAARKARDPRYSTIGGFSDSGSVLNALIRLGRVIPAYEHDKALGIPAPNRRINGWVAAEEEEGLKAEEEELKTGNVQFHPWELAGLGRAPFRFLFIAELPSKSLLEANPDAYNNAMRDLPTEIGLGSCHFCGNGIMNNYIVEDADGKRSAVGSECIRKLDLPGSDTSKLKGDAHRAALARERRKREEKALAKRRAFEEKMAPVWKKEREEREAAREKLEEELKVKRAENATANAWLVEVLAKSPRLKGSDFLQNFYEKLFAGDERIDELSDRVTDILREVYGKAKSGSRVGSKAFKAAAAEFDANLEGMKG